jgi:hypothetical protein
MPYEVYPTTADSVIAATDAAMQKPDGVNEALITVFLNATSAFARDTLQMARELSLLKEDPPNTFKPDSKCAQYLITAERVNKAAVFRFILEQYEPYKTFKERLALTGLVSDATQQTKALHNISAHHSVISQTFCDLGMYTRSLISEGAGLFRCNTNDPKEYLLILDEVIQDRESAKLEVINRLGKEAVQWIDPQNVLENLITAYQRAAVAEQDPRAPIVHAGNAVESFLAQVAGHYSVSVAGASGINAKAQALIAPTRHLLTKHNFMIRYLGHVRNAADHGTDSEIGTQWDISPNTAVEYVHVAQSVISAIVAHIKGKFIV